MSNVLLVNLVISLLFLIGIIAVILFIQIKLSRSKNKYLGLILPVLSFLFSILMVLSMSAFFLLPTTGVQSVIDDETGEVIEETEEIIESSEQESPDISDFLGIGYAFLVSNIPTAVLGGVYLSERNKKRMKQEINKMKIEDL